MEMPENNAYRTLKGYEIIESNQITNAMEDYLEMICRYTEKDGYARINNIASKLNVKPSSSSKMVSNLKKLGLVEYEKYSIIKPTEKGQKLGNYLLHRHKVIHRFFCLLNNSENEPEKELEQTEKVEHFINAKTLYNIERLIDFLEKNRL